MSIYLIRTNDGSYVGRQVHDKAANSKLPDFETYPFVLKSCIHTEEEMVEAVVGYQKDPSWRITVTEIGPSKALLTREIPEATIAKMRREYLIKKHGLEEADLAVLK